MHAPCGAASSSLDPEHRVEATCADPARAQRARGAQAPSLPPGPPACSWFAAGTLLHTWWPRGAFGRGATKQMNGEMRYTSRPAVASVPPALLPPVTVSAQAQNGLSPASADFAPVAEIKLKVEAALCPELPVMPPVTRGHTWRPFTDPGGCETVPTAQRKRPSVAAGGAHAGVCQVGTGRNNIVREQRGFAQLKTKKKKTRRAALRRSTVGLRKAGSYQEGGQQKKM